MLLLLNVGIMGSLLHWDCCVVFDCRDGADLAQVEGIHPKAKDTDTPTELIFQKPRCPQPLQKQH